MKNLVNLNETLFRMMDKLENATDDDLEKEIKRNMAMNETARTIVTADALMLKAADTLWGLPIAKDLPLIPAEKEYIYPSKETLMIVNKRKAG